MLQIVFHPRENFVVITPSGPITAAQIDDLTVQVDGYINETDQVPNFVLHAKTIPYWDNFTSLVKHLKFVKSHQKIVQKVAFVSDSKLLWLAKPIVDHFVAAKVRRFPDEALDDAISWVQTEDDHPGAFIEIPGLPSDVIGIEITGLITSQDYTNTLVPLIKDRAKKHDKLKLICVLGDYFDGYSPHAMWDDMRFGLSHLTTFSKLAVVTDQDWIRSGAKFFGIMMPTEVMVYDIADLDDAKSWIIQ